MLIYNMTIKTEWAIQQHWLLWMHEIYIPRIMQSGCFITYQLMRLLAIDEEEGPTYALQLYAAGHNEYNCFNENFLPETEKLSYEKWGNSILCFPTLMEIIGKDSDT